MSNVPIEVVLTVPINDGQLNYLRGVSPRINITAIPAAKVTEIPPEVWVKAEILYTASLFPKPEEAPALQWIQSHFAGIDRFLGEPLLQRSGLLITTLSGAAASQSAEHILAMLLAFSRKLPALMASQRKSEWPKDRFERFTPFELRGKTVGIVGYGSIGRQVARLLQPFDVTILATKRDAMNPRDLGYTPEKLGDPNGDLIHRLYPPQALRSMLSNCHFVIVTVPLTAQTTNLLNEEIFNAMPTGSFLVDTSRGGVVNHPALLAALKSGQLAGAALDVFPEEPLPASSPLWNTPNLILTPHISGGSAHYTQRAMDLFSENLHRYLAGIPLYNLYNPDYGY